MFRRLIRFVSVPVLALLSWCIALPAFGVDDLRLTSASNETTDWLDLRP